MTRTVRMESEPIIRVGLLENKAQLEVTLNGRFRAADEVVWSAGEHSFNWCDGRLELGHKAALVELVLTPLDHAASFTLTAAVGHQFHWSEKESQRFGGALRLLATDKGITVINEVALETYLSCVVCSEMAADCPLSLIEAHSVISRSWLLAQRVARARSTTSASSADKVDVVAGGTVLRWYDQSAHQLFDVCAEDHCQRYHGLGRIGTDTVLEAIEHTRGQVLTHDGAFCDTRYSKCCGGLTEDARVAWGDDEIPYLVPFFDGPVSAAPGVSIASEAGFSEFLHNARGAYCQCDQGDVLDIILPERDRRTTPDFFRWCESLSATRATELVHDKLGLDLGRVVALEPVARGESGRLWKLRIVGEKGHVTIGKELEIRRVLSATHLLSSAFMVESQGASDRPDTFVLHGAGWGHGVGLCQIGAAIMAMNGTSHRDILAHYFPGTALDTAY